MITRRVARKAPVIKTFIHPDGEYKATLKLIQETVLYGKNVAKLTFSTSEGQISMHWEINDEIVSKFNKLTYLAGFREEIDLEDLINSNVTLSINYSKITKIYKL